MRVLRGVYSDTIIGADGPRWTSAWHSNLIVDSCYEVIAALLKRDAGTQGILWFAIGTGAPAWDGAGGAPTPAPADRSLVSEVARNPVAAEHMRFVGSDGRPSFGPTPSIEVRSAFAAGRVGEAPLREFGLFGGFARILHIVFLQELGQLGVARDWNG